MIIDYLKELFLQNFGHNPTAEQQKAIAGLAAFILGVSVTGDEDARSSTSTQSTMFTPSTRTGSRHEVFVMRGFAGTGKTSLVAALVKTMVQLERECILLAPTGRAAKVFATYADHPAFTIHKQIYRQKSMEADAGFSLDFNSHKHTLFIVDEASMIADSATDSPYGSGHLLDDLIQYVYSSEGCRLIVLGDTAQLPPVGEEWSPALQPEVWRSYGLSVTCITLTQVVRQERLSGILSNATALRAMIEGGSKDFNVEWTADVVNTSGNDLIESLADSYRRYGTDDTIVVCRSNKRAHIYNMGIRNQILDREEELSRGDIIMIAKNNYHWLGDDSFLANGDIARVVRVRNERELYGFRFADCTLILPDYDDREITATVLLDTLHTEAPALGRAEQEQLYNRVLEDYADIPYKRDRLKKLREDPYYNALQIKYAYAVTCHKAQGGQWADVYVDQGYITPDMLTTDYYRWLYTAFTRATQQLHLVNWK